MFEQVDAFSMLCMIDHILVEDAAKNGIHEGVYETARKQIKKIYKQAPPEVIGSDGKPLPPEKSVAPEYVVPDENGYSFPGMLPPAG